MRLHLQSYVMEQYSYLASFSAPPKIRGEPGDEGNRWPIQSCGEVQPHVWHRIGLNYLINSNLIDSTKKISFQNPWRAWGEPGESLEMRVTVTPFNHVVRYNLMYGTGLV